jgi:cell shape-determining protein MreC
MMISSFRHDRQQQVRRRKLFGTVFLFLFVILFFRDPVARMFSSVLTTVAVPIWGANYRTQEWWGGVSDLWSTKEALVAENKHLQNTLDLVALEAYSREELRRENEQLKAALGRASGRTLLYARVLSAPGRSPYDTLVLDVGLDHGLVPGMEIFTDGDFVIGKVSKVMEHSAIVTLYSSYGNELQVTIGTSSIPATMLGQGGGNFLITLPRSVDVSPGDLVHIPAVAPEYAGVVSAVDLPYGSSLENVYLKWPFNVYEVAWVYVAMTERVAMPTQ